MFIGVAFRGGSSSLPTSTQRSYLDEIAREARMSPATTRPLSILREPSNTSSRPSGGHGAHERPPSCARSWRENAARKAPPETSVGGNATYVCAATDAALWDMRFFMHECFHRIMK